MAWSASQQASAPTFIASGSTTKTAAFPSNVVAGRLLAVLVFNDANEAVTGTPTDTVGTVYSKAGEHTKTGLGYGYIFYGIAGGSGANTFSVTFVGNSGGTQIWPLEITGNASSAVNDSFGSSDDGGTTSTTVLSGQPSATALANELALAFIITGTGDTAGLPSGWSGFNDNSSSGILGVYQTQVSSGATPQATWSQSPAGDWIGLIATFKPAAGGGTVNPGEVASSLSSAVIGPKRVLRPQVIHF